MLFPDYLTLYTYPDPITLHYESALIDGTSLPAFVSFDSSSRTYGVFSNSYVNYGFYHLKLKAIATEDVTKFDDSLYWFLDVVYDPSLCSTIPTITN